jgi:hypothetical protein
MCKKGDPSPVAFPFCPRSYRWACFFHNPMVYLLQMHDGTPAIEALLWTQFQSLCCRAHHNDPLAGIPLISPTIS